MYVIYNSQYVLYPYRYIDIWTPYEILDSHNLTTRRGHDGECRGNFIFRLVNHFSLSIDLTKSLKTPI